MYMCMHMHGGLVGLLELTVKLIKFQNGVSNAVVACAPDSFIVLKYYMYTIKTIYRCAIHGCLHFTATLTSLRSLWKSENINNTALCTL